MDKTIDMAREANLAKYGNGLREGVYAFIDALKAFEALVRADEREACAKVCEDLEAWNMDDPGSSASKAIRARGNT
jgi:hypothetical protein